MLIRNVKSFLAHAALVACTSLAGHVALADTSPLPTPEITIEDFKKAPFLDGVDAEGRPVRYLPQDELPATHRMALLSQQGGGALKFGEGDDQFCAVNVHPEASAGMVNRHFIRNSAEPSENMFLRGNVHAFYIAAHELSHCFNNTSTGSVDQLVALYKSAEFSGYSEPLNMLELSIRETYADLSAVMLGASKTGDWTVFTDGVMPYRTGLPDPSHVTINAVSTIISKVDPRMLKGMSFNEVNVLVNDLFQDNFMTKEHKIDMNSQGVRRIAQEMEYLAERFRAYTKLPYIQKEDQQMLTDKANLLRGFATKIYSAGTDNATDFAFLTALQIVDARNQLALAKDTTMTDPKAKWVVDSVISGSVDRERYSRAAFQFMSSRIRGSADLDQQVAIVSNWVGKSTKEASASLLNDSLDTLVAENTVGQSDPSTLAVREAVAQRIQAKLTATRSGVVAAAASPEPTRAKEGQSEGHSFSW